MAYSETYCSRDARGILRGKCLACVGCFCYHVILRDKNIKCISCGHPPGQHAKREGSNGSAKLEFEHCGCGVRVLCVCV